jgi:hypothetical protein
MRRLERVLRPLQDDGPRRLAGPTKPYPGCHPGWQGTFWGRSVKPLCPPSEDSICGGQRRPSELCVLAYVGPELRTKNQENQQCMTFLNDEDFASDCGVSGCDPSPPLPTDPEEPTEFRLQPGERYGWWAENDPEEGGRQVATVHGAVNNLRVKVLLDTGATMSMISLDLARTLKLKINSHKRIKVSGLGGVPTYISSSAEVKVTLGHRVVYILELWVTNIGEGVDALLGMDFMVRAGVRLCIRYGLVVLPDQETVWMYGDVIRKHPALDISVCPPEGLHLRPGESASVRIRYGQANPLRDVVWTGRGDRWVTQLIYGAKSWVVAVKVVNISNRELWIDTRTNVARIIPKDSFPSEGRFVRPGLRRYLEWQRLIYENTLSRQARLRAQRFEQMVRDREPPAVQTHDYRWPTKLLLKSPVETGEVRMVQLQEKPRPLLITISEQPELGSQDEDRVFPVERHPKLVKEPTIQDDAGTPEVQKQVKPEDTSPESSDRTCLLNEVTAIHGAVSITIPDVGSNSEPEWSGSSMASTPVRMLEEEYERCMRVNAEELDLEPAVYIHEGSELMAQLRDQLAMLPESQDLSPKCDLDKADVGEPGVRIDAQNRRLKGILEHHRSIFLGYGNAAPAPARGVVCDLDVGDAKPVAQRPRSDAPHIDVKVYELLKKLLETGLIKHSDSPWASPIVIVLKKNGVDIRMCIDYRIVNGFIQLSNYPLPLIDDLLIGFKGAMWFMSLDMASGFWAIRMPERAKLISAFVCPFGHLQWERMPFGLKNAPLIYQHMINNCLWGFVCLPPEEEKFVDQDVLDFLKMDPQRPSHLTRDGKMTIQIVTPSVAISQY